MGIGSALRLAGRPFVLASQRRPARLGQELVVSFSFDDFPRSASSTGAEILASHGGRGTYYVAPSRMGSSNDFGEMFRREDVESLAAAGHEIASHSYSHLRCRSVTPAAFRADVLRGRDALRELGVEPSDNFAYPFGDVTVASKRILAGDMASCRGVIGGVNGPLVDLNLLRANRLYGGPGGLGRVRRLLRRARRRGGWLIFYTHDVRDRPSPWGCTPSLLEGAVAAALREGARIATVADVVKACRSPT